MNKSLIRVLLITICLLMIPLIGMQFSNEINWDITDFVVMGFLIFITGTMSELVKLKVKSTKHRITLIIALVLGFVYVWAELAVGIFTNIGS